MNTTDLINYCDHWTIDFSLVESDDVHFQLPTSKQRLKTGITHAEKQELKTRRACFGTSDGTLTGIFIDWAALYQLPRSDAQTIAFKRALKNINCWYASIETHVRKFVSSPSALLRKNLRSVGKTMVLMTRTFSGTALRHMLLPQCRQCEQDVAKELKRSIPFSCTNTTTRWCSPIWTSVHNIAGTCWTYSGQTATASAFWTLTGIFIDWAAYKHSIPFSCTNTTTRWCSPI